MTVLQLISSAGFYGAESMLVGLSQALLELGCDVTVGVLSDTRHPHEEVAEAAKKLGLKTRVIPCNGRFDFSVPGAIRQLLSTTKADVLHAHGYKADLYGYLAALGTKTKLVSTCHNWPNPAARMQFYAKLDRLVLRLFDAVTTPSPVVENVLKTSGVSPQKTFWIRNGVPVAQFQNAEPVLRNEFGLGEAPVIGSIGRLVPDKGGSTLLEAAVEVVKAFPAATFVFIGDGPSQKEWVTLASVLGLSTRVFFTGVRKDMPRMYASLDIMVLPSYEEAMPMCLLEAMAAGRPVVATRVGAIPDVVTDGEQGILIEPRQAVPLSEAIKSLLGDPSRAQAMGEAGRNRIEQRYSAEAMAAQYLSLYRQAVEGRVAAESARATS